MRLPEVIPGNNLNEAGTRGKKLGPSLIPEQITRENPVLAIGYFGAVMRKEPG